jgi:enoyl-CoA hydratase
MIKGGEMEHNFINYVEQDGVAILELDDPSANTLTFHLLKELEEKAFSIAANASIRGLILIGRGDKFFSGGVNIGMLLTAGKQHNSHFILYAAEVLEFIESMPIPVVTIINGNITGGGLELALIAEYRIAIEGTYNIGFPEVRLGVIPGMGGTQRLARLVGPQRALELITQGEFINPDVGSEIGLIDLVLNAENFRSTATTKAIEYISQSVPTLRSTIKISEYKLLLNDEAIQLDIHRGLATITVHAGIESNSCVDILLALNEYILTLRTDDSIFCVLIDIQSKSFGCDDTPASFEVNKIFTAYVASKLSGYPRIVALNFNRVLGPVEFELALHCDYRFITEEVENLSHVQRINMKSTEIQRFSSLLGEPKPQLNIAELTASGIYQIKPNAKEWLYRFVPPIGAGQAIGYAKLAITKGYKEPLSSSLLLERHLQEQLFMARDSREGMKAYIEKRKPHFVGV